MFGTMLIDGAPISIDIPNPASAPGPATKECVHRLPLASPCAFTAIEDAPQELKDIECDGMPESTSPNSSHHSDDNAGNNGAEHKEDMVAMYEYKLMMCPTRAPHDWTQCVWAHDGEVARRRNPSTHSANPCVEYEKHGTCPRGQRCPYAHGVWERGLHPQRYRTSMCSKGEKCDRKICFFAHNAVQMRKGVSAHYYSSVGWYAHKESGDGEKTGLSRNARKKNRAAAAAAAAAAAVAADKELKEQEEKKEKMAVPVKERTTPTFASLRLDPGVASFVPGDGAGGEFPTTNSMSNSIRWALWARTPTGAATEEPSLDWGAVLEEGGDEVGDEGGTSDEDVCVACTRTPSPPALEESGAEEGLREEPARALSLHSSVDTLEAGSSPPPTPPPADAPADSSTHAPTAPRAAAQLSMMSPPKRGLLNARLERSDSFGEREARALDDFNTSWVDGLLDEEPGGAGVSATTNNLQWGRWIMNVNMDKGVVGGARKAGMLPSRPVSGGALGRLWELFEAAPESVAQCVGKEGKGSIIIPPNHAPPPEGPGAYHVAPEHPTVSAVGKNGVEKKNPTPALFLGIHPQAIASGEVDEEPFED